MKYFFSWLIIAIFLFSCNKNDLPNLDFKQEMRDFVQEISTYAKEKNPDFIIIPQNGVELVSKTGEENGQPDLTYINAIDGIGQEDLLYGYNDDDKPTPDDVTEYLKNFLDLAKDNGNVTILATDYCSTKDYVDNSYEKNNSFGYLSFAADHRALDDIPAYPSPIYNVNDNNITKLSDAQNYLYLINPDVEFSTAQEFVDAVSKTDYDVIIMDYFFNGQEYTDAQIEQLKTKANGSKRLIISYMSIGEAEDYRYYWDSDWDKNPPSWLEDENPLWKGNYKVRYWEQDWKNIIFGSSDSYLDKIINKGFDGTYLDIIDAFEYFENKVD